MGLNFIVYCQTSPNLFRSNQRQIYVPGIHKTGSKCRHGSRQTDKKKATAIALIEAENRSKDTKIQNEIKQKARTQDDNRSDVGMRTEQTN